MPANRYPLVEPLRVELLATRPVDALVAMRAEAIALRLQEVLREALRAVAVDVAQRGAHPERRNSQFERQAGGRPQAGGQFVDHGRELARGHEVHQIGLRGERGAHAVQDLRPDDAPAAPDLGDFVEMQVVTVLLGRFTQERKALRVPGEGGQLERVPQEIDAFLAVAGEFEFRPMQNVRREDAFLLHRRKDAGFEGGVDGRDGHAQVQRVLRGPFAGTLLTRTVEDQIDHGFAGLGIGLAKNGRGDLQQVGVHVAGVPPGEDLPHFGGAHAEARLHQVVRLADELHDGVLDAVVYHLDVMPGSAFADISAAGLAVDFGGDGVEHRFHQAVGLFLAAGHQGGAVPRALLAAAHAHTDEAYAGGFQFLAAAVGVGEEGVTAVDEDVSRFEMRFEIPNHGVDRVAGGYPDQA